jgi:hypothetical protein
MTRTRKYREKVLGSVRLLSKNRLKILLFNLGFWTIPAYCVYVEFVVASCSMSACRLVGVERNAMGDELAAYERGSADGQIYGVALKIHGRRSSETVIEFEPDDLRLDQSRLDDDNAVVVAHLHRGVGIRYRYDEHDNLESLGHVHIDLRIVRDLSD